MKNYENIVEMRNKRAMNNHANAYRLATKVSGKSKVCVPTYRAINLDTG